MAKHALTGPSGRKREWFARRQVYLRTGQDSQYVELSPLLQVGVALGFGALALWLIGASYGALTSYFGEDKEAALLAKLGSAEQALGEAARARDAALDDAARIPDLEAELAAARATAAAAIETDETRALTAELDQTKVQLEELHLRLSESKADQAALQARFEAEVLATTDAGEKTAEEAASLHAQLEEAFVEIETLEKDRDAANAKLAALSEENSAKGEAGERNTALLKAATAEIERLQGTIAAAETEAEERTKGDEATISKLEEQLGEVVASRNELEREVADLNAALEAAKAEVLETEQARTAAAGAQDESAIEARLLAQSIDADLKEADLLATIDDLRAELAAGADADGGALPEDGEEVIALRQRAAVAEAELERLILGGLKANAEPVEAPAPADAVVDPGESERLRSELLAAKADIIKLNADVKAGKQRLAEQDETENGQVSRPDNSAKLEQQLASTRSRVQQLNKALADAKLREVAIDLALISVVPSPSPPAPR
ncbi:MAG: hypothetical protein OEU92_13110 [Alphaproteobacteria bacterium]|nr:hypothetical protein [Alphaproteobacteria bacterium]